MIHEERKGYFGYFPIDIRRLTVNPQKDYKCEYLRHFKVKRGLLHIQLSF